MKKLSFVAIVLLVGLLSGCAGLQLSNDTATKATAYTAGRFMYYAIDQYANASIRALELSYNDFMAKTVGMDIVPAAEVIALYNEQVLILSREVDDPYGLIGDLNFFLTQCGGQFAVNENDQNVLTKINDVPRALFQAFQIGWINSKRTDEARKA